MRRLLRLPGTPHPPSVGSRGPALDEGRRECERCARLLEEQEPEVCWDCQRIERFDEDPLYDTWEEFYS